MMKLNKILKTAFFLISVHFLFTYIGVYKTMHLRPRSIHSWSQCERASIALNYYQTDMNFFKPRIHKLHDGDGITGLEFPFVNYTVAILYKLFGFHEFYYRAFVLATLLFGVLLFYFLSFSFTKNYLLSLASIGAAFFSPVLMYYAANFQAETTSLGFVLASWYFIFKYFNSSKKKYFYWFFTFAALAALVKITSLIVFGVVFGLVVLDHFKFFHKTRNNIELIPHKILVLCYSALGTIMVFAWYKYANWLSDTYHSDAFLLSQRIVTDKQEAISIWTYIKKTWAYEYYAGETYVLISCILISMILGYKKVSRLLFTVTFLTFLGSCCFVFLLFFQFRNHDYYIIPLLPFVFLLLLTFADFVSRLAENYFPPLKFIVVIILFFNGKECVIHCKESYSYRYDPYIFAFTGDFTPYEDLEPKLRSLGIKRTDVTLSGTDETYCNTLYLMNQMGWTYEAGADHAWVRSLIKKKNIQYMVINDTATFNRMCQHDFRDKIIGYHKGLFIYKLK
jgi:hypothetical protein